MIYWFNDFSQWLWSLSLIPIGSRAIKTDVMADRRCILTFYSQWHFSGGLKFYFIKFMNNHKNRTCRILNINNQKSFPWHYCMIYHRQINSRVCCWLHFFRHFSIDSFFQASKLFNENVIKNLFFFSKVAYLRYENDKFATYCARTKIPWNNNIVLILYHFCSL